MAPLRSVEDTPTAASACQAHFRNTITAPRRERHTGQPEARLQGAGPLALRRGKREVPGSARGPGYGNVERGSASKPGASMVSQIGRESTPSVVQGTRPCARVETAPGAGRVTRRSGRLFIVGRVTARGGWARRSGPRAPADQRPPGWRYRCPVATWSPPGTTSTGVRHGEPRQAGRPRGYTKPSRRAQSRLLLCAETSTLRRAARPAAECSLGRI
jgi:hypothetical protein